jgi:hypothetical protein
MIPENCWIQVILICASWYLSKGLSSNVIFQRWDSHGHYNAILAEIIIFKPFSIEILLGSILLELNFISKSVYFKSKLEVFALDSLRFRVKVLFVVTLSKELIVFTCPELLVVFELRLLRWSVNGLILNGLNTSQ